MSKTEWKKVEWRDVIFIINGKNQASVAVENGEYPICGSGGIMGYASDYLCPENTIVIGRKGSINKPYFMEQKFWNVDTAFGLIPNKEMIAPKFLYYFCSQFDFQRLNKTVTIPSLTKSDLLNIKMFIPPLPHQRHIAATLDKANELIALRKKQLAELDTLAEAVFYDMFGDPVKNEKGWEISSIGKICQVGTGGTPDRKKESEYYGGNIPWVKTTEVQNCDITKTEEAITEKALKESNCKIYPIGTLLLAMYGQGKTRGQVARLQIKATTNQACAAIIPSPQVLGSFLYAFLRLNYDEIRSLGRGGNQENLNLTLVKEFHVLLPPLPLQTRFATVIEKIEEQKAQVRKALQESEDLFQRLMQDLFKPD